jgi:hypothetical protein
MAPDPEFEHSSDRKISSKRVEDLMRKIVPAIVFASILATVLAASPAVAAEKPNAPIVDKPTVNKPVVKQAKGNPCAEYGAGFARIQGSDTCVRIGGAVGVDVGIAR